MAKTKIAKSEIRPIEDLKLWDKNPRSIKTERFEELKARLQRQGQIKPLLITKHNTVIGGNMRLRAMQELGWSEVWVSLTEAETDKEIFDLALTDNEEFGYYEQEQLAELALGLGLSPLELKTYEVSLGAPTTLDLLLDKFGPEVEEDEVPEVDEVGEPESRLGEVYQLGVHRLMCGDSTDADNVKTLMDGVKADMVFTDPPYGIGVGGTMRKKLAVAGDDKDPKEFYEAIPTDIQEVYVWGAFHNIKDLNFTPDDCIVWVKENFGMGRGYRQQYEVCFYKGAFNGSDSDVWNYNRDRGVDHQTPKPVALCARAIKNSNPQIVLDLFLGSGSTLIACEQTDRTCYGMELDPKYCDVIRKRYANHIGEGERWQEVTPAINQLQPAS